MSVFVCVCVRVSVFLCMATAYQVMKMAPLPPPQ